MLGSADGLVMFQSVVQTLAAEGSAAASAAVRA
jgi:hypothetical protein